MTATPKHQPKLTMSEALDKCAAECVEEILAATGVEGGDSWFVIVRRKMKGLVALNATRREEK